MKKTLATIAIGFCVSVVYAHPVKMESPKQQAMQVERLCRSQVKTLVAHYNPMSKAVTELVRDSYMAICRSNQLRERRNTVARKEKP